MADAKVVIEKGSDNDLSEFAGWEQVGGELTKLEPGQAVRGSFKGQSQFETTDRSNPKVLKLVNVYEIQQKSGTIVRLLGVTMIDAGFARIEKGTEVFIRRNTDRKSSRGNVVQDYTFLAKQTKA